MMLSLGMFVFEIGSLPFLELSRSNSWKHAETSRVGAADASQYVGPGDDLVTLSGWIAPPIGDPAKIQELRDMGDTGEAWPLTTGAGEVLGAFTIRDLEEKGSLFFRDGTPRRRDFTLKLKRVPDEEGRASQAKAAG